LSFDDMIAAAKSNGYSNVDVHGSVIPIDTYAKFYADQKRYEISDTGGIFNFDRGFKWFCGHKFV
jgi:hypothetical protein